MFRQIGEDKYSCVAPPGFEKDPAVTRAIQSFDPGVIPIWRLQRWKFPGDAQETLVVHHGLGRYYPFPRHLRRPFHVTMPAGAEYPAPNFLDAIFEDTSTITFKMGGPGVYMPWDWSIYYWCREQFDRITAEKYEELVEAHRERMERQRREFEEELEYRRKQVEPWILKKLEGEVSEADWMQLLEFHAENQRRRTMGLDPIRRKDAKLYVGAGGPQEAPQAIPILEGPGRSPRSDKDTYGRVAPDQVRSNG